MNTHGPITISSSSEMENEYEDVTFENCDFSDQILKSIKFVDCRFKNCNFSNTKIGGTLLNGIQFHECKLIGIDFSECNPFIVALHFQKCKLELVSFCQMNLKGTLFKECQLHENDFSHTNLTDASFIHCDLLYSHFERTNLTNSDLRTAINYVIDPELNTVKGAKVTHAGLPGFLLKYRLQIE
jgi:fluoroquinolone resistance protein